VPENLGVAAAGLHQRVGDDGESAGVQVAHRPAGSGPSGLSRLAAEEGLELGPVPERGREGRLTLDEFQFARTGARTLPEVDGAPQQGDGRVLVRGRLAAVGLSQRCVNAGEQEFPIIPNPEDPDGGNVYKELRPGLQPGGRARGPPAGTRPSGEPGRAPGGPGRLCRF
jgi:hypothetical protein